MHTFFCDNIVTEGNFAELYERDSHHLFKTLRARLGETVGLMDGKGTIAKAEVAENKKLVIIEREIAPEPLFKLNLYIAPPRRNKMDDLLRQCTELGIWSINPVISERSISEPDSNSINGRWRTIAIEACKQSRNPFLPAIREPVSFESAVDLVAGSSIPAYYGSVSDKKSDFKNPASAAALFIGPEGGFTEKEEIMMADKNFNPLKLGNWVLRIETAALCVAGLLIFHGNKKNCN